MKHRWLIVAIALVAAMAFALSVWGGRWWSIGEVEIGPYKSKQCFGGECRPASLTWIGGTERWLRMGMATWAGGLLSMFVLMIVAAGVAARRIPKLAAKTALVSIVTVTVAGVLFVAQYPGVDGAGIDRGLYLFACAIVLGVAAVVGVLRARPASAA